MTIHREGYASLTIAGLLFLLVNGLTYTFFDDNSLVLGIVMGISLVLFLIILQFFRFPKRNQTLGDNLVICPCDGKVVVIEETMENEFFKDKRLQISVFMSPINVHANWYPVSGKISYLRYHEGKYLVAWHPKASTENERTTIVIEKDTKTSVMCRQIAGALAKRIVYYPHENDMVRQGAEMGFIKFGSRVDIYLPLGAKVNVKIGDKTTGGVSILAEL